MTFPLKEDVPSFPTNLPCASIKVVSYDELLQNNNKEAAQVLDSCKTNGILYLNLQTCEPGQILLDHSEKVLHLAKRVFAISHDEKTRCAMDAQVDASGYKPMGTVKTTDADLRPDTTESFKVKKDHLLCASPPRPYPDAILDAKGLLRSFAAHAHECGMAILRALEGQLGLPPKTFTDLHLFDHQSHDNVLLTHKPAIISPTNSNAIGLVSHSDFGSVTILFNWVGGLQIRAVQPSSSSENEWLYVKPLPGHAIINLGDAMSRFTNGLLPALKHRVVSMPGTQACLDRYSVVYFAKPHDQVLLQPLTPFLHPRVDAERMDVDGQPADECKMPPAPVGGKFGQGCDEGKIFTAGEWSVLRETVVSANRRC